jgi:hypothetical protein
MEKLKFVFHPEHEPINYNPYNDVFESLFGIRDNQKLQKPKEKCMEEMKKHFKIKDGKYVLPRGSVLYYGSNTSEFNIQQDKLMLFSIDVTISIWKTLQKYLNEVDTINNRYQYLHEIKLRRSITIDHIIKNIITNPKHILKPKKSVCIHPQAIIRGIKMDSWFFVKKVGIIYRKGVDKIQLGMEITIPHKYLEKKIKSIKTYVIDPQNLYKNKDDFNYDITNAIVDIPLDIAKSEKINIKQFKKIFI